MGSIIGASKGDTGSLVNGSYSLVSSSWRREVMASGSCFLPEKVVNSDRNEARSGAGWWVV